MNYAALAASVLALAGIGWTVYLFDPRVTPGALGLLLWFDLFWAGRRRAK